jgi:hypothetical protein
VVNIDVEEVHTLVENIQVYSRFSLPIPKIVRVNTLEEAKSLDMPFYIVGTVPDMGNPAGYVF